MMKFCALKTNGANNVPFYDDCGVAGEEILQNLYLTSSLEGLCLDNFIDARPESPLHDNKHFFLTHDLQDI